MENNGLRKEIKLGGMIAMAAGGMVAAWMVEIKYWFEIGGVWSFLSLVACAIMVLPLCFIYSELTSMMPYAGGQNIWISNALGWNTGFAGCWAILLLYVMAMPTVSYGIASMLGYIFPITNMQLKIISIVILVIWYFLTNSELKILAKMQNILFWSTLVVAVGADIIFIFSGHWQYANIQPIFRYGAGGFTAGIALLIMKFVGFDLIPQLSEEANFPKKDLWKAFVGSIGCTVLIYGLAIIAVGGVVGNEWIDQTDIVDPRVADLLGMHWLAMIIVIMGALTCITTLSSFWLSASRILYGAAKQHQMTSKFVKLNQHGQPQFANLIVGILSIYFTAFAPDAWVSYIYTIYGVVAGIVYLLVCLSFIRLRKTHPDWDRPYLMKGGAFWGYYGILFCIWVIIQNALAMDSGAITVLIIYIVLGLAFWGYAKMQQKKDPQNWAPIVISPETVGRDINILEK